jgi:hypothetical protein
MVDTRSTPPRGLPRNQSPRSDSPTKQQIQAASRALAKKKQKQVAQEKKAQQKLRDLRHNELQKKCDSNSPTKIRARGDRGGAKEKKKKQAIKKNLLKQFEAGGVARGSGADEDRDPTESPSGSEGTDEEFSPAKDNLKNDADYNSVTNVKEVDDVNAAESEDEAELKGDQVADGGVEQEEVIPTSPPNLKQPPETVGQDIIDLAQSPKLGPVLARSVVGKDGKKVKCIATLPGREFCSDDIDDAVFDDANCDPPYVDWTVDATERMSASSEYAKGYTKYFSDKNLESVKGNTITAKVGKNTLRARDLDTLKPKAWLNDQVIDVMTKVLAGRATTESTWEVAVFDTQFTKLILERPSGSNEEFYVYDRVVTYAEKRLLAKVLLNSTAYSFPTALAKSTGPSWQYSQSNERLSVLTRCLMEMSTTPGPFSGGCTTKFDTLIQMATSLCSNLFSRT